MQAIGSRIPRERQILRQNIWVQVGATYYEDKERDPSHLDAGMIVASNPCMLAGMSSGSYQWPVPLAFF